MADRNMERARAVVDRVLETAFTPFGSSSDDWISDPDRAARCETAAEVGADGSTHREVINDQRAAVRDYFRDRYGWNGHDRLERACDRYFDDLETWHEKNGSLDQEVG